MALDQDIRKEIDRSLRSPRLKSVQGLAYQVFRYHVGDEWKISLNLGTPSRLSMLQPHLTSVSDAGPISADIHEYMGEKYPQLIRVEDRVSFQHEDLGGYIRRSAKPYP